MARALLAIVVAGLLVILVLVFLRPQAMIAPGALVEAHAAIGDDCFACHTPLLGISPQKCGACHALDRIGRFTTRGIPIADRRAAFHQQLTDPDCRACHTDHAGLRTAHPHGPFSHDLLRADVRQQCDGCHAKPADALHERISGNCSACHDSRAWTPADFDHGRYFRLDGEHDTACETCHTGNDYGRFTCYGCHEHAPARIRAEHLEEGIRDFENCVDCHRSADEVEGGEGGEHGEGGDDD